MTKKEDVYKYKNEKRFFCKYKNRLKNITIYLYHFFN